MGDDVHEMAAGLRRLAMDGEFVRIHHFSQPNFKKRPPRLGGFEKYCTRRKLRANHNNVRTIRRGFAFINACDARLSFEEALAKAWEECPLVTR